MLQQWELCWRKTLKMLCRNAGYRRLTFSRVVSQITQNISKCLAAKCLYDLFAVAAKQCCYVTCKLDRFAFHERLLFDVGHGDMQHHCSIAEHTRQLLLLIHQESLTRCLMRPIICNFVSRCMYMAIRINVILRLHRNSFVWYGRKMRNPGPGSPPTLIDRSQGVFISSMLP